MNPHFGNFLAAGADQYKVLGWIVLLPLLGAVINGFFGKKIGREGVYITGVATVAMSFLLSLFAFAALVKAGHALPHAEGAEGEGGEHPIAQLSYLAWEWFKAPAGAGDAVVLKFRYVLDSLSAIMLLVVTGVGTLIHIYSTGYMSHDEGYARFFSYLNLFMFSMLNLILADNIVLLFVGWEGVGLCSYLLIGFWYTNPQYASAGRKAFIVNRIGDVGVILGITILAWKVGAYDFGSMRDVFSMDHSPALQTLSASADLDEFLASTLSFGSSWLHDRIFWIVPHFTWGGLATFLLFIGCTGKSAQIPLYVWLPDAMAGPTPVSALIHAATMVTAGVYLLCRLSFVYVHFPAVMGIIAITGALTALFAATIALAQNELKKVLAYSTVSQLGFMFLGCGVGAFGAGLFHVYTHAMFKACLFLGAGAVMHACRDKQDLRELGGLKKYLPWTYATFGLATLAIIGTPGFSGFFSKDEILFRALASTQNVLHVHIPRGVFSSQMASAPSNINLINLNVGTVAFVLGLIAATLTAFYMCRLLFLTFWGEFKGWSLVPGTAGPAAGAPTLPEREPEPANAAEAEEHDDAVSNAEAKSGKAHDDHDAHDDHGHDDHGHGGHGHGHGNPWDPPHDNPWNMTGVLVVLAFMSVVAGYIGLPTLFTGHESVLARWLEPTVSEWHIDHHAMRGREITAMLLGTLAFALGSASAYWMYVMEKGEPAKKLVSANGMRGLYRLVLDKWRIDELYDAILVRPLRAVSNFAANFFDRWIIDGIVKLVGVIPRALGAILRKTQTGTIHVYGTAIALGALAIVGWAVARPAATIGYRADGTHLTLQAYGGPGYSYEWDVEGDGTFADRTNETHQEANCTPTDTPDGRRVCRVNLRVRNAFGFSSRVTRTIEIQAPEVQEPVVR
jgi:NADH-quinone oxidoreductase subunit L